MNKFFFCIGSSFSGFNNIWDGDSWSSGKRWTFGWGNSMDRPNCSVIYDWTWCCCDNRWSGTNVRNFNYNKTTLFFWNNILIMFFLENEESQVEICFSSFPSSLAGYVSSRSVEIHVWKKNLLPSHIFG